VGSGAMNVGREHTPESMIVGQEGCSIASRNMYPAAVHIRKRDGRQARRLSLPTRSGERQIDVAWRFAAVDGYCAGSAGEAALRPCHAWAPIGRTRSDARKRALDRFGEAWLCWLTEVC
jgi:hypothetical protein